MIRDIKEDESRIIRACCSIVRDTICGAAILTQVSHHLGENAGASMQP